MTDPANWREPYRSMDAGGSDSSAGYVGWAWIDSLADKLRGEPGRCLAIEHDSSTIQLWDGTKLLAASTTFRDPMNFTVLIRWAAEGVA